MYLDKDGNPMKGASLDGYLAVGVPGSVAGFETAREKYGTLTRQELMAPAIRFAKDGFMLEQGDARIARRRRQAARQGQGRGRHLPETGRQALWHRANAWFSPISPRRCRSHFGKGHDAFYKGADRRQIVKASQAKGGILAKADFEQYTVRELEPVTCNYRGYEIVSSPPPSSGGVIICEILNVLEGYPLSYLGFGSAETVHLMVEAMRHAYVDRNSALGDPDFVENPVEKLPTRIMRRRSAKRSTRTGPASRKDLKPKGFGESTGDHALFDHRR